MAELDLGLLSREAGLLFSDGSVEVSFIGGRRQVVRVDPATSGMVRAWSPVARPSVVAARKGQRPHSLDVELDALTRNRLTSLVGFRLDRQGWLIGETWVYAEGLDAAEWKLYLVSLAQACDRLEAVLTGRDRE